MRPLTECLEDRRLLAAVSSIDFDLPNFSVASIASGFGPGVDGTDAVTVRGNGDFVNNRLRLTTADRFEQGTAFTNDRLTLGDDVGFSTNFSFNLGGGDGIRGGDGIAFVLFGGEGDPALPSFPGGSLGYGGLFPSLAVEFDTQQTFGDPEGDHVAIHAYGDSSSPVQASALKVLDSDLNDGRTRWAWIDYDAPSDTMRVYLNDASTKPALPTVSATLNLSDFAGDAASIGLTAANSWLRNQHDVLSWSFDTLTGGPGNTAPTAGNDSKTLNQNAAATPIDVLANDGDVDGDSLIITSVGQASHGTASTDGNRVFYRPAQGYAGLDSFTYTISDGRGGSATATVSVTVDQAPASGSFALESGSYTVNENAGFIDIGVLRTGGSDGVATLDFLTVPGTASAGVDYASRNGTLRFEAGETRKTIRINITDDTLVENDEIFGVSLDAVTGADLGAPRTTQITITDNDAPPPPASGLPWIEDFSLPNNTRVDNGATAWSIDLSGARANSYQVGGSQLRLIDSDRLVTWTSKPIDTSGVDSVSLSLTLNGTGPMETSGRYIDYVEILYAADGGSPVLLERQVAETDGVQSLRFDGLTGDSIEIIIRGVSTTTNEIFYIDDVILSGDDAPTVGTTRFYEQAENADQAGVGNWTLRNGGSGGGFVEWTGPSQNNSPSAAQALAYSFTTDVAGLHDVHLSARTTGSGDNSVWVRLNTSDRNKSQNVTRSDGFVKFNSLPGTSGFESAQVSNSDTAGDGIVRFWLDAGTHTIEIAPRERGADLDGLYVTNTPDARRTRALMPSRAMVARSIPASRPARSRERS